MTGAAEMDPRDLDHLRAAIAAARDAASAGELPYGSVLVTPDGSSVVEHNRVTSTGDVTAHPELLLARHATLTLPLEVRARTTLYSSCEPCTMCANAIARAGIGRVVFALSTERLHELQPADLPRPDSAVPTSVGPVPALADEAEAPIVAAYRR